MGQEILYCNQCGTRLIGEDSTRGRAHTFNNRRYCKASVPQTLASQGRVKAAKSAAAPAPARSSATTLLFVGLAFIAAVVVILYVIRTERELAVASRPSVTRLPPTGSSLIRGPCWLH